MTEIFLCACSWEAQEHIFLRGFLCIVFVLFSWIFLNYHFIFHTYSVSCPVHLMSLSHTNMSWVLLPVALAALYRTHILSLHSICHTHPQKGRPSPPVRSTFPSLCLFHALTHICPQCNSINEENVHISLFSHFFSPQNTNQLFWKMWRVEQQWHPLTSIV